MKTLKNIDRYSINYGNSTSYKMHPDKNGSWFIGDNIRQAAKEWEKKLGDVLYGDLEEKDLLPYKPYNFYHMDEVRNWVRHFFNLEEDE